jgi:hypothetical protein
MKDGVACIKLLVELFVDECAATSSRSEIISAHAVEILYNRRCFSQQPCNSLMGKYSTFHRLGFSLSV